MTVIKSLVEFAEAVEADKDFLVFDGVKWNPDAVNVRPLMNVIDLIEAGQIRIKPETITLYEYAHLDVIRWHDENCAQGLYFDAANLNRIYTLTGRTITGEVKDD